MSSTFRRLELEGQFASLRQPGNCPEGVYVSPKLNVDEWNGVIFVRKGYYAGSVLRFTITFPASFPLRAPQVTFAKGSLVHPLVDPANDRLALACGFPRWNAQSDNVSKLLYYIKGIFKEYQLSKLNDGLAVNVEAWRLYRSNRTVFAKLAAQCATMSNTPTILYTQSTAGSIGSKVDVDDFGTAGRESQQKTAHADLDFRVLNQDELEIVRRALFVDEDSESSAS